MKLTLTNKIIIGFILGLVLGEFFFLYFAPEVSHDLGAKVQIVSKIFLRLIKMIVGPLVFCTLVVGIAKLGDFKAVGRIGIKTIGYFYFATILSLVTGLVVVNITQPGSLQSWPKPAAGTETGIDSSKAKTMEDFILHIFPDSFFKALAENDILRALHLCVYMLREERYAFFYFSLDELSRRIFEYIHEIGESHPDIVLE